MTIRTVANMSEFSAAASASAAGDEILLKPGEYVGHLYKAGPETGRVTIRSADPANRAVIRKFFLNACRNLTFTGLILDTRKEPMEVSTLFEIGGCTGVVVDGVEVVGDYLTSKRFCQGMSVQFGRDTKVINSTFSNLLWGLAHIDTDGLIVQGNAFNNIGSVGVRGGGSSNVDISDNRFIGTHMHICPDWHGDHIQFWTNGTKADVRNIKVCRNYGERGPNGSPVQGIAFGQMPGFPYRFLDVTIEDNVIRGALFSGMDLGGLDGFSVQRNTVQGYADQESRLYWLNCRNGVIADNKATKHLDGGGNVDVTLRNNATIAAIPPPVAAPPPTKQPTSSQRAAWLARAKTIQGKARELRTLAGSVVAAGHPGVALMDRALADTDALVAALADGGLAMWKT